MGLMLAIALWTLCSEYSTAAMAGVLPDIDRTGTCALSRELGESSARREFLIQLARDVDRFDIGSYGKGKSDGPSPSSVEEFYGNVRVASFNDSRGNGIDRFSIMCLSCHDGLNAPLGEISVRNSPAGRKYERPHSSANHPIGMDYAGYAASNSREFKNHLAMNRNMILIDGKVGCLTCHNPLNPEKKHLVMNDFRSALCLSCHKK